MKLLALCGFLFFCLLCLNAFTAEGRKTTRACCSKILRLNKKVHKGKNFKMIPVGIRKYCKPCPSHPVRLMVPGPLPQLK